MRAVLLMLLLLPALLPRLVLAVPAQPVTMIAYLDRPVYQIGQPIVLSVDLRNMGTHEAIIGMSAYERSAFSITIAGASGRVVSMTPLGKTLFAPPVAVSANAAIRLAPGATFYYRFHLAELYDLSQPGSYTVNVSHTFSPFIPSGPFRLAAGPIKLRVQNAAVSKDDAAQPRPVMMTASLDKSVYQIGQPIVLEVDLHNSSTKPASLGGGAFEIASFRFMITNAAGRLILRSALGDQALAYPLVAHANPERVLKPGGTRRIRFDLAALYDLSQIGVYFLSVSRDVYPVSLRHGYTVSAGPLKIRIMKAAQNSPTAPFVHDPQADLNIP